MSEAGDKIIAGLQEAAIIAPYLAIIERQREALRVAREALRVAREYIEEDAREECSPKWRDDVSCRHRRGAEGEWMMSEEDFGDEVYSEILRLNFSKARTVHSEERIKAMLDEIQRLRAENEALVKERGALKARVATVEKQVWIEVRVHERAAAERDAALARAEKAEKERDEALKRYGECVDEKTEERRNYVIAANERDTALARAEKAEALLYGVKEPEAVTGVLETARRFERDWLEASRDRDALRALLVEAGEALDRLLRRDEINTCQHDETHRGGVLWEICDSCGAKWAEDEGGKPEWKDPQEWIDARDIISKIKIEMKNYDDGQAKN